MAERHALDGGRDRIYNNDAMSKISMTKEQVLERFYNVIEKGLKHDNYDRVVNKAKLYSQLITGEGMDSLLKQFTKRETGELFEQRKDITQHIIQGVCKNLMDVSFKLPRSNSKTRIVSYSSDNEQEKETKVKELENVLKQFWGDQSLDDWFASRFIEMNYMDPNAFIILSWDDFDANHQTAQPYPLEASSEAVVDFKYINNILQYLIVARSHRVVDPDGEKAEGENKTCFLLYRDEDAIRLTPIHEKHPVHGMFSDKDSREKIDVDGVEYIKIGKTVYEILAPEPYKLDYVPAFRVGYMRDLYTKGQTMLNPFDAAIPYMKKSIKANSEMDLTMALIAFPQMIRYAEKCPNKDCLDGQLRDGGTCPTCGGTGVHIPTSVQDAITLKMPKDKENLLDLSKLIHFAHPPIEVAKHQDEYIEKLTQRCYKTIYGSEAILKSQITTTATEKQLDIEKTYDALYPMSVKFSRSWVFAVKLIAQIIDKQNGLVVSYTFGKDFKLKSKADYIEDRRAAKEAGVPSEILNFYDNEIMRLNLIDNPEEFNRFKIIQRFNPFLGKSTEEILILMSSNLTTRFNKVLYSHLSKIFEHLLKEHNDFFSMQRTKQTELVNAAVDEMIKKIEEETPKTPNYLDQ